MIKCDSLPLFFLSSSPSHSSPPLLIPPLSFFLSFWQGVMIAALSSVHWIHELGSYTTDNVSTGIQNMALCIEMFLAGKQYVKRDALGDALSSCFLLSSFFLLIPRPSSFFFSYVFLSFSSPLLSLSFPPFPPPPPPAFSPLSIFRYQLI